MPGRDIIPLPRLLQSHYLIVQATPASSAVILITVTSCGSKENRWWSSSSVNSTRFFREFIVVRSERTYRTDPSCSCILSMSISMPDSGKDLHSALQSRWSTLEHRWLTRLISGIETLSFEFEQTAAILNWQKSWSSAVVIATVMLYTIRRMYHFTKEKYALRSATSEPIQPTCWSGRQTTTHPSSTPYPSYASMSAKTRE